MMASATLCHGTESKAGFHLSLRDHTQLVLRFDFVHNDQSRLKEADLRLFAFRAIACNEGRPATMDKSS